jgi:hypothetical protein
MTFSDSVYDYERQIGLEQPSHIDSGKGIIIHKARSTESWIDDGGYNAQANERHWGQRNGEDDLTKSQNYHYRKSTEVLAY